MQFQGAVIKEQGVIFAIVIVKPYVLNSPAEREQSRRSFSHIFPSAEIILMAQDSRGVPTYHGRRDIVEFLSNVHISQIPWKKYNYS